MNGENAHPARLRRISIEESVTTQLAMMVNATILPILRRHVALGFEAVIESE